MGYCYILTHKFNQHPIYVGSCNDNKERERGHKKDYYNPNRQAFSKPFYEHVRKYGTIEDWHMNVIYKGPDFKIFEKNYIKSTWEYNLNKNIPLQTKQEKKDIGIAWRRANKKYLLESSKKWQKDNEEAYKKSQRENKVIYRAKYKDKINEKAREKVACDICGKIGNRAALGRHKKSKTCMAFKS